MLSETFHSRSSNPQSSPYVVKHSSEGL